MIPQPELTSYLDWIRVHYQGHFKRVIGSLFGAWAYVCLLSGLAMFFIFRLLWKSSKAYGDERKD